MVPLLFLHTCSLSSREAYLSEEERERPGGEDGENARPLLRLYVLISHCPGPNVYASYMVGMAAKYYVEVGGGCGIGTT
jgi:hypothetical protein